MSMDINKDKNMELWNLVCDTIKEWTKDVILGNRKFTTVCAYKRIQQATEIWGSFGSAWGIKNEQYNILSDKDIAYYNATLFYPNGEIPIHSDIEIIYRDGKRTGKYNEDWTKKLATDALTKGLSKLGFSADIFQGQFKVGNSDDNKYIAKQNYKEDNRAKNNFATLSIDQITEIKDIIKTKNIPVNNFFNIINAGKTKFNEFESIPETWYNFIITTLNKWGTK